MRSAVNGLAPKSDNKTMSDREKRIKRAQRDFLAGGSQFNRIYTEIDALYGTAPFMRGTAAAHTALSAVLCMLPHAAKDQVVGIHPQP